MSFIRSIQGSTPTAIASPAGGEIEIDLKTYSTPIGIQIVRIMVEQISGSASNFYFSIGDKAGFTTGSIHEHYLSANTASATGIAVDVSRYMLSSISGKIYFKFLPDASADNLYAYSIVYLR